MHWYVSYRTGGSTVVHIQKKGARHCCRVQVPNKSRWDSMLIAFLRTSLLSLAPAR